MSGELSSAAGWSTLLEPLEQGTIAQWHLIEEKRPDDPRLGEIVELWRGDPGALTPGRPVLIGFPQDEGVRRNHGRAGAAQAPDQIRKCLYRLTPWDAETDVDLAEHPPLDMGDVRIRGDLEETQKALGEILGVVLQKGSIPILLGGGHEIAYGHYLGYLNAQKTVGIINIDAHLDVRGCLGNQGHSGSPFRQALEHPGQPLPGTRYVCLGAQPHAVSRKHWLYAREHGCTVCWCHEVSNRLVQFFVRERDRLEAAGCHVYVTIDADAVQMADVSGVSAPNPVGLSGKEVISLARLVGQSPAVSSLDLVEINPRFDPDGQSCRWAALVVWNFLAGLASRSGQGESTPGVSPAPPSFAN